MNHNSAPHFSNLIKSHQPRSDFARTKYNLLSSRNRNVAPSGKVLDDLALTQKVEFSRTGCSRISLRRLLPLSATMPAALARSARRVSDNEPGSRYPAWARVGLVICESPPAPGLGSTLEETIRPPIEGSADILATAPSGIEFPVNEVHVGGRSAAPVCASKKWTRSWGALKVMESPRATPECAFKIATRSRPSLVA